MKIFMAASAQKRWRLSLIRASITGTAKHIIHDADAEVGFTATGTPDNYRMASWQPIRQGEWGSRLTQRDKRRAVIQNVLRQLRGRQREDGVEVYAYKLLSGEEKLTTRVERNAGTVSSGRILRNKSNKRHPQTEQRQDPAQDSDALPLPANHHLMNHRQQVRNR